MVTAAEAVTFLNEQGYQWCFVEGDRWYALRQFIYTVAIVSGPLDTIEIGYSDRWCFNHVGAAMLALAEWNARKLEGEPEGWHRHTPSNRRRDPATGKEWIRA